VDDGGQGQSTNRDRAASGWWRVERPGLNRLHVRKTVGSRERGSDLILVCSTWSHNNNGCEWIMAETNAEVDQWIRLLTMGHMGSFGFRR